MSKTHVIYHSADFDGIFCREIGKKFLGDKAEYIGWDFGHPTLDDKLLTGPLIVMDLPVDRVFGLSFKNGWICKGDEQLQPIDRWDSGNIIWIDHHKSSIETHPNQIPGYRIDGVSACRLAWQWFTLFHPTGGSFALPSKERFVNREVSEPYAVRLAGEYDIWDKRDPNAELFQHGLRSRDITNDWPLLLSLDQKLSVREIEELISVRHTKGLLNVDGTTPSPTVLGLLEAGKALQYARTRENESIIKEMGFNLEWEGLKFLACNAARYNSHLFTAGLTPEHDACFGFKWTGKNWSVSLYHAPGKEHHDLSLIAKKHGGGGHRGACGFACDKLAFLK